jgi:hypothetical protein
MSDRFEWSIWLIDLTDRFDWLIWLIDWTDRFDGSIWCSIWLIDWTAWSRWPIAVNRSSRDRLWPETGTDATQTIVTVGCSNHTKTKIPQLGLEPATYRLSAERSTNWAKPWICKSILHWLFIHHLLTNHNNNYLFTFIWPLIDYCLPTSFIIDSPICALRDNCDPPVVQSSPTWWGSFSYSHCVFPFYTLVGTDYSLTMRLYTAGLRATRCPVHWHCVLIFASYSLALSVTLHWRCIDSLFVRVVSVAQELSSSVAQESVPQYLGSSGAQ